LFGEAPDAYVTPGEEESAQPESARPRPKGIREG
jgi:hypothetical protein